MYENLASPVSRATARAQRDPAFPAHMNGPEMRVTAHSNQAGSQYMFCFAWKPSKS